MIPWSDPAIRAELKKAWADSDANEPKGRHEEGGYLFRNEDGTWSVIRWPRGSQAQINPPQMDALGRYNGNVVAGAFHTHPNPPRDEAGIEWDPAPSGSDRRWHSRRKIPGLVISRDLVYESKSEEALRVLGTSGQII